MVYVATQKARYLAIGFGGFAAACLLGYRFFGQVKVRVSVWLNPWADYENTGYQIAQSLFAIGTGGWFGLDFTRVLRHRFPLWSRTSSFQRSARSWEGCLQSVSSWFISAVL